MPVALAEALAKAIRGATIRSRDARGLKFKASLAEARFVPAPDPGVGMGRPSRFPHLSPQRHTKWQPGR